jgi:hypothetical protein
MKSWILGLAALLLLFNLEAKASVLIDWGSVPESNKELTPTVQPPGPNGTYTTGSDFTNVGVMVAGSGFTGSGLHDPKIDPKGSPFPVPVLSTVADFKSSPAGPGTVTFTLDFSAFKQGVKDVNFTLFDVDATPSASHKMADVVTFNAAAGDLTLTGSADNKVGPFNTVTGTGRSSNNATDFPTGDVNVQFGSLPLKQIVFTWTRPDIGPGENRDEIAIGNITFTPVPEVGQLAIGLVACLLGALWLHKNRRKRAPSIP